MQYDLTLLPNGVQRIEAVGRFFKFAEGQGKVRIITSKGSFIDLAPGQGVAGEEFTSLTVRDMSGFGQNVTVLAGIFDFRDTSVTGSMVVTNDKLHGVNVDVSRAYKSSWFNGGVPGLAHGALLEIVTAAQNLNGIALHRFSVLTSTTANGAHYLMSKAGGIGAGNPSAADEEVHSALFDSSVNIANDDVNMVVPAGRSLYLKYAGSNTHFGTRRLWYSLL